MAEVRDINLLKHPANSDTLDNSVALTDLLQCALATVLEDYVCDANLAGSHVTGGTAGVPVPCLDALGSHLSEQLNKDAAGIGSFAGVYINKDDGATEQGRVDITSGSACRCAHRRPQVSP